MSNDNRYAGIGKAVDNSWTAKPGASIALTSQSLIDFYEQIKEQERVDNERMYEWSKRWEESRKSDPRRCEAVMQAMLEVFGRMGDPVNPIIAHPKQVKRYEARLAELLEKPQPFDPNFTERKDSK